MHTDERARRVPDGLVSIVTGNWSLLGGNSQLG